MMLDTLKVSDDLTDSARQYRANILDVVSAMECSLAGKPHPRINTLTPDQSLLKWIGAHTSTRPPTREQWEKAESMRNRDTTNNGGFGDYRGYGQGRKMGD